MSPRFAVAAALEYVSSPSANRQRVRRQGRGIGSARACYCAERRGKQGERRGGGFFRRESATSRWRPQEHWTHWTHWSTKSSADMWVQQKLLHINYLLWVDRNRGKFPGKGGVKDSKV
jgi:hypothetical protein